MAQKSFLVNILLFICVIYSNAQQWNIKGTVQNEENTFLSYATVYAHQVNQSSNNNILAFSTTNDEGYFVLSLPDSIQEVTIVCNYLGYQKNNTKVNHNTPLPLLVTMLPQNNEIQEVIVTENKIPIQTQGDTIIYNASQFRDSTERTVEDLLRKLPGVEVDDNGQVSVGGQPIKKLLIEGTDMFGRKYTIGSQNIRADFIESVEVINHYQENEVVKNITSSEDIVLNLKLKEKVKNILSGVLNFGGGYGEEIKATMDANVFLISKKRKLLLISNNGNTGNQYGVNELKAVYGGGDTDWSDAIQPIATFTDPIRSNYLNFRKVFTDNSNSSFTTLRNFFDIGNVKLKINGTYAYQDDAQRTTNQTTYLYEQDAFENNFEQKQYFKNHLAQIDFKLNYVNPKVTRSLDFMMSYEQGRHQAYQSNTSLASTMKTIRSDLDFKNRKFFVAALYTQKLTERSALFITTKNRLSVLPESFKGNNIDFNFLQSFNFPFDNIYQQINFRNRLHEISATFVHKFNRWTLKANSTLLATQYDFSNTWLSLSETNQQEEYIQKVKSNNDYTVDNALVFTRKIGQLNINAKISNFYRTINIREKTYRFSAKDNFSFLFWVNKNYKNQLKLWGSYSFQNRNFSNNTFLPASYIQDNFSIRNSIVINRLASGHQISMRVSRNNSYELTSFYLGSSVGLRQKRWASDLAFNNSIVSATPFFTTDNNYFRIYGMWERFIPKTKTNITIKPSFSYNEATQVVEGILSQTNANNITLQVRAAWRINQATLLSLESRVGKSFFKTENQSSSQFTVLRLNPFFSYQFKGWKTKTSIFYYKNFAPQRNASLLGSKFRLEKRITIKKWKPTLTLEFNNLFNTQWYSTVLNSENFTYINQVEAIPPFFVFSFDYTF